MPSSRVVLISGVGRTGEWQRGNAGGVELWLFFVGHHHGVGLGSEGGKSDNEFAEVMGVGIAAEACQDRRGGDLCVPSIGILLLLVLLARMQMFVILNFQ